MLGEWLGVGVGRWSGWVWVWVDGVVGCVYV